MFLIFIPEILSEYSFIRLLDFFPVLLVLFFPFSLLYFCYLFLFFIYFQAGPPGIQQDWVVPLYPRITVPLYGRTTVRPGQSGTVLQMGRTNAVPLSITVPARYLPPCLSPAWILGFAKFRLVESLTPDCYTCAFALLYLAPGRLALRSTV